MKRDPSRPPQPKTMPVRHRFEHQVPTQIHDPEEDMMVLARWTHRAMKNKTRFWGTILGITLGLVALVLLTTTLFSGSTRTAEVWSQLEMAKSAADRVKVAEDNPNSPVAVWGRLEAATEYYNQGFDSLPNSRDVALPLLKKALDNFEEVAKTAPKDSPQARAAALGKARTLEARNELEKAIEQYDTVAKTWPGTNEAEEAKKLAEALRKPEAAAFYKELYAYSPTKVTLPPLGTQNIDMPLAPAPGGISPAEAVPGGTIPTIPLIPPPPPGPVTKPGTPPAEKPEAGKTASPAPAQPATVLPDAPFHPGAADAKAKPAAPETKAASPKPAPAAPSSGDKPKS